MTKNKEKTPTAIQYLEPSGLNEKMPHYMY